MALCSSLAVRLLAAADVGGETDDSMMTRWGYTVFGTKLGKKKFNVQMLFSAATCATA